MTAALVAIGAGLGSALRYLLGQRLDGAWHYGTIAANTTSSLLLGACVGWSLDGSALALAGTGFCGGLSTYSSLAVQTRDLGAARGLSYALTTVLLGLGACALGYWLVGR
jgi:CrcB protein